jgi:F-type H+-transporting ATPase subunit b
MTRLISLYILIFLKLIIIMDLITPGLGLLVWTTLIFLSVLFVLTKFAWKPIAAALREREDFIENALSSAERAKAEMAKLKADNEQLLQEARKERDKILKESQAAAANLIAEAKEKASAESARIIEAARLQINNEKKAALTELKNLVASTALEISELILKRKLDNDEAQKQLIESYLKESKLNN